MKKCTCVGTDVHAHVHVHRCTCVGTSANCKANKATACVVIAYIVIADMAMAYVGMAYVNMWQGQLRI